jgi:hypothetical protein
MHDNSAGMGKLALESEFNSAGCIITALVWVNQRWKANLTALKSEFNSAGKRIKQRWMHDNSAGMGKLALESEFNSAGCMIIYNRRIES